jgi:opacity protein-like surface antigen
VLNPYDPTEAFKKPKKDKARNSLARIHGSHDHLDYLFNDSLMSWRTRRSSARASRVYRPCFSAFNSGWTAGFGVEWAFWSNWSARIEYDFVGLNSRTFSLASPTGGLPAGDQFTSNNRNIQLANVGINYKFGPW